MGIKKRSAPAAQRGLPPVTDAIRQKLRFVRRIRLWGIWGLIGPPLVVALIVLAHRLSGGAVGRYLLAHDPWTYRGFSTLFTIWIAGLILLFLNRAVKCPRCGLGFRTRMDFERTWGETTGQSGFGANVFATRCLNCGVHENGSVLMKHLCVAIGLAIGWSSAAVPVHAQAPASGPKPVQVVQSDFAFIVRDDGSVVGWGSDTSLMAARQPSVRGPSRRSKASIKALGLACCREGRDSREGREPELVTQAGRSAISPTSPAHLSCPGA